LKEETTTKSNEGWESGRGVPSPDHVGLGNAEA